MSRLIDTMDYDELSKFIDYVASSETYLRELDIRGELEKLFAPVPHWSDNLDVSDSSTWVLCWVSDKSASSTCQAKWIYKVNDDGSYGALYHRDKDLGVVYQYATPVDLNLRYNRGDE